MPLDEVSGGGGRCAGSPTHIRLCTPSDKSGEWKCRQRMRCAAHYQWRGSEDHKKSANSAVTRSASIDKTQYDHSRNNDYEMPLIIFRRTLRLVGQRAVSSDVRQEPARSTADAEGLTATPRHRGGAGGPIDK